MNELINYFIKNKYYVDVIKIDGGCKAVFPKNILRQPNVPELEISYFLLNNGVRVKYNDVVFDDTVPRYMSRLMVQTDIILKAINRDLHLSLIQYFDGLLPKDKIIQILPIKLSKEEKALEKKIVNKYSDIIFSTMDGQTAENLGIFEGYNSLVSLISREGY